MSIMKPSHNLSAFACPGKDRSVAEASGSKFGIRGAAIAGALGLALTSCQSSVGDVLVKEILVSRVIYGPAAMLETRVLNIAKANTDQQHIAACNGRNAISNRTVEQKISSGQARKVVVSVPPKNGNPGGIMKVNPATGKPENDRIYQLRSGSNLQIGDVIKLNGIPCVVYDSYSQ